MSDFASGGPPVGSRWPRSAEGHRLLKKKKGSCWARATFFSPNIISLDEKTKRRKESLMAARRSRGESQTMMKANSRRATKHPPPPPLHQGASKENYNNTAFSFLINEDCYLVGGRAGCKGSWMIGKHQTEMGCVSVCVCVFSTPACTHACRL